MIIVKIARLSGLSAVCIALAAAAHAQDLGSASPDNAGTMNLAPGTEIARVMSDDELGKQRGGFMGIAFSASFYATVENFNGNVTGTGTGTSGTTGVTGSNPPVSYNIQGGQVQLNSFIGNLSSLNGVFQLTSVNGIGNIVNSHLTLNVALVNLQPGSTLPSMQSLFPSQ